MTCEPARSSNMVAHTHAGPSSPELPSLPETQVSAILEQIRIEQARLLREQQDVIIAQVMKNLNETGIAQAVSKSVNERQEQHHPLAQSKLEQSLHSLVLHSLDESGLNYPHVQRAALPPEDTLRSPLPSPSRSTCLRSGKTIVVSRSEATPQADSPDRDAQVTVSGEGDGDALDRTSNSTARSTKKKKKKPAPALITESPLQDGLLARDSRRGKARGRRRQRHDTACHGDPEREEAEFDPRKKIGYKTLAILDRSRALLDDMKRLQHRSPSGDSTSPFVSRLRQTLATPPDPAPTQLVQDETLTRDQVARPESPAFCAAEALSETPQSDPPRTLSAAPATQSPAVLPTSTTDPNVVCTDIEVLQPPAHSPENENEWENELARQILTIYATSVKAKRATNRPTSHASNRAVSSDGRLGASCSLPALNQPQRAPTTQHHSRTRTRSRSPPRAAVQYSWEPSQRLQDGRVVVNMPKVPRPIWFAGTGAVKAVWCALAEGFHGLRASPSKAKAARSGATSEAAAICEHQLCEEVRRLEAKQQYTQCITTLETLLVSLVRARGVDALDTKLWKQLVVTCNAFASRCVDYKKYQAALQLIKQAEHLLHNSILVDDATRFELLAYLYDTYGHYYYRRGKSHAGLQYMFKAHEIHGRQSSWAHLAKCRLHIANLLSQQGKHQDAMGYMASILEMIEENKLEDQVQAGGDGAGASAQKVCLAAVCYNNIAIEQLHLRAFEAANVSSGNAKRLAKLCLSYSNRWLAQFDATSNCVDLAIATLMEDVNAATNAQYKS